jgi:hypothetical protein
MKKTFCTVKKKIHLIGLFLCITLVLVAGRNLYAQTTLLGVHSNVAPFMAQSLGIEVVRVILYGADLLDGNYSSLLEQMQTLQNAGYKGIVSVSWNNYPGQPNPGPALPPVGSDAYYAKLEAWQNFILTFGPYLYGINIDGEPVLDYPSSDLISSSGESNVITWFQALAATAGELRASNPSLSNLLIGSPSLSDWINIVSDTLTPYDKAYLQWAFTDPNIDLVDVHAHVAGTYDVTQIFSFLSQINNSLAEPKMITATEWSQAAAVRNWLNETPTVNSAQKRNNPAYAKFLNGSANTNSEYILFLEENPTDLGTWNTFVATAPYDPNFMTNAFEIMQSYNLLFACYEGVWQGPNPNLNTKALYASETVLPQQGAFLPNYNFLEWFMSIPR